MKLSHTSLEGKHLPVMIDEVLKICNPKNGGNFMDCTFGAGGYSKAILKYQETNVVAFLGSGAPVNPPYNSERN